MKILLHFIIALILSIICLAQSRPNNINGLVTDEAGSPVKQAQVILLTPGGKVIRQDFTNERGEFAIANVNADEIFISVIADGLTQSQGVLSVKLPLSTKLEIKLGVAAIRDSIVITATKTAANAVNLPESLEVFTVSDITRSQHVSVLDVLRAAPGVTIMQSGRRGGLTSLFVRGGESDYTKVLIDGVPVNDAGGAYDLSDLTTDNIGQVELVRSAGSALYGSDAMSGVLQFITQRGTTEQPELTLTGEGGSFAFNRQQAKLSGANQGFDYSLSFTHLRTNGRDRNDDYQNRIASANLGYRFNDQTSLRLTARNENSGLGVAGATARYFPDPDERAKRRRIATGAHFDNQTTRQWQQIFSFAYAENNQLSIDPLAQDLSKPDTPLDTTFAFNDFALLFNSHQKRRGVRYQTNLLLPLNNLLSAGLEYEKESAVFDSGFAGRNRVAPERRNIGFFVQDQFSYHSRFVLTAGLRVENNRADVPQSFATVLTSLGSAAFTGTAGFGTQIVPKVSALFVARQGDMTYGATRLRISYGEGIKAATLVEAFSPNSFFLGNPGLKPERARTFDVGMEQLILSDRLRVEATYFENRFRNQIAYVGDPASFGGPIKTVQGVLTSFVNNDRARGRGLELGASYHPVRRLRLSGHYTLTNTKLLAAADIIDFATLKLIPSGEIGLPLLRRPRHSGMFNFAWVEGNYDFQLESVFIGKRRDVDPVTFSRLANNSGYIRSNLTGSYHFNPRMSAFVRIENLLNQKYQEILGFPAYRLNFAAGLRVKIGGEK